VSATRLLVLGVVRMRGEAHGYQVRQDLQLWAADRWANTKPGSIYHALRKLAVEDLVEAVSTATGLGPEKVVYRITPAGEGEFFFLLNKAISDVDSGPAMFNAALPFITTLDRRNLIFLLRTRVQQVRTAAGNTQLMIDATVAEKDGEWGKPPHIREMFQYWVATSDAEVAWLNDFIARLEAGEYTLADDDQASFGSPPR
jgi:DNA-binding PadR family transcriptional regulator